MKLRQSITSVTLVLAAILSNGLTHAAGQPNVLMIAVDDLRPEFTENGGDVADNVYDDGHSAERAVKLLEKSAKDDRPFFLAVGFKKPHLPFVAPGKYWEMYDRDSIKVPSREKMKGSVPWARSTWPAVCRRKARWSEEKETVA